MDNKGPVEWLAPGEKSTLKKKLNPDDYETLEEYLSALYGEVNIDTKLGKSEILTSTKNQAVGSKELSSLISIILIALSFWYYFDSVTPGKAVYERNADSIMKNINAQVTADFLQRYNIAKSSNNKMDACVQAGIVAAAYLQEHNQSNYRQWKNIESADCRDAGVPR